MKKNILSRIRTRAGGLTRDVKMHINDVVRDVLWVIKKRKFTEKFPELAANHKWVFVIGCNNSGTSIVQRIMNQTGCISTMPLEGQRYTKVFPRAMKKGHERVWMEYKNELMVDEESVEMAPRLVYDWLSHIDKPLKDVILEKTPANLLRMEWLDKMLPNCYFIGLIRNGYAVCEGIRRKSHKSLERAAIHWNQANIALEENKIKVKRYLELHYEDIVDSPDEAFSKIASFIGIEHIELDRAMKVDFGLKTVTEKKTTGLKNFNRYSIENLDKDDFETINRNAKKMLVRFGYYMDHPPR